jgi:putative transposase
VPPSPDELRIKRRIDEIYTAHPFYGSRKITVELQKEMVINRKAVQRHMREMGIAGIVPGPNTSKRAMEHRVFPYLLRHITASHPNHIFGIDITYIRLLRGWLYLVAALDWFSRYVLAWELSDTLAIDFVLACARGALALATPQIWNSDQGSHFTSPQYIDLLLAAGVQISMDGRGRARDNTLAPRLRAAQVQVSSLSACGAPSNTRRSTSPSMPTRAKPGRG